MNKQRQNGFTILELMVVIIIIGIMASLAIPNFVTAMEKSKVGEATTILGALRSSQMRFKQDHGAYESEGGWNDPRGLDVTIDFAKYFLWVPRNSAVDSCVLAVARVQRNGTSNPSFGAYRLCIQDDGTIKCADAAVSGVCTKLGF